MRARAVVLAGLAVVVGACGQPPGETVTDEGPQPVMTEKPAADLLFLGSTNGVTVFDADQSAVTFDAPGGVPSQQGNAVVRALARSGGTEVTAFDPLTGDAQWTQQLAEDVELRMASSDGRAAVLGPVRPTDGSTVGRDQTTLTVVRDDGSRRDYPQTGNFEPETFSLDARKLFVVEYLPPLAPVEYTLKMLDLESGALEEVFDAHGGQRGPMRGTARTQAYSPDGRRLYTYYQIFGEPYVDHDQHGVAMKPLYAFVHVLDLVDGWAHCVDLMPPFGTGVAVKPALTVSPDGERVYVADQGLGQLAEIDTAALSMTRTAPVPPTTEYMTGAATISGESLWLAFGNRVSEVDLDSLAVTSTFSTPTEITALRGDRAAERLFVALYDRVDLYEAATGRRLDEALTGGPFTSADASEGILHGPRDVIKCAC
ncbi:MAG: YncE family protein [Actinomycetota bacterium]